MRFMFRRAPVPNVNNGASFHRRRDNEIVETAKVIAVSPDAAGILHVRFNLKISSPRVAEEEQRTLSLEYFHRLYGEAVTV
jgi:hypothetical protein